jgi:hypothetical protein
MLSLTNFKKVLPSKLITAATKCKVRECDEINPGAFISYVDDRSESYDVSVTLANHTTAATDATITTDGIGSAESRITGHDCDCNSSQEICVHKVALIMYISYLKEAQNDNTAQGIDSKPKAKAKGKANVPAKSKVDPMSHLLNDVEHDALKTWLLNQLTANKDLALAFTAAFAKPEYYSPASVAKLTADADKATIGTTKRPDKRLIAKLINIWRDVHAPIIKSYGEDPTDENAFDCYYAIIPAVLKSADKHRAYGATIEQYAIDILGGTSKVIAGIEDAESWNRVINFFIAKVAIGAPEQLPVFNFLANLTHTIEQAGKVDDQRKTTLIRSLLNKFRQSSDYYKQAVPEYNVRLLTLALSANVFDEYAHLFVPLPYLADYNLSLFETLVQHGKTDTGIKMLWQLVESTNYQRANLLYLSLLTKHYKSNGNEDGLVRVLKASLPITYNYKDYVFLASKVGELELESLKSKMMQGVTNQLHQQPHVFEFAFNIFGEQAMFDKMIRALDKTPALRIVVPWFESLILYDKDGTLKQMLGYKDAYAHSRNSDQSEIQEQAALKLAELTLKHYGKDHLRHQLSPYQRRFGQFPVNQYIFILIEMVFGDEYA